MVHSSDTGGNAIVTPKNVSDFICTKTLVVIGMDFENCFCDFLIFLVAVCQLGIEMLVVGVAVYPQNTAQGLDVVPEPEFMNSI